MKSRLLVVVVLVTAVLVVLLGEVGAALAGGGDDQQWNGRLVGYLVAMPVGVVVGNLVKAMAPAGWLPKVAGTRPSAGYRSGWADRVAGRLGLAAERSAAADLEAVWLGAGVHIRAIMVDPVASGALVLSMSERGGVRIGWKRTGQPIEELPHPYRVSTGWARPNPLADRMGFAAVVELGTAGGARVFRMKETDHELLQQLEEATRA